MSWNYDSWLKNYNKRMDRWFGVERVRTRDKKEKVLGKLAKNRLQQVLEKNDEIQVKSQGVGKYGRCIAQVYVIKRHIKSDKYHGKSINQMMVQEGHAKEI